MERTWLNFLIIITFSPLQFRIYFYLGLCILIFYQTTTIIITLCNCQQRPAVAGLVRNSTASCTVSFNTVFYSFLFCCFQSGLQLTPGIRLRHVMGHFFMLVTFCAFVILTFQICDLDGDFQGQVKIPIFNIAEQI